MNEQLNFQHFLTSEFDSRKHRNPSYSLRAYARDLGLAAPKLSEILRGKSGISEESARRLSIKLNLSASEAELFVTLVAAKHSRQATTRQLASKKLEKLNGKVEFGSLALESFKVIADWYHFAILELTEISGFRSEIPWIAKRLKVPNAVVQEAVKRLFDFGLLAKRKDGSWFQTEALLSTPSEIPSSEIRKHHRQILAKANQALDEVPVSEREFASMTLSMSSDELPVVKAALKEFRRNLTTKMTQTKNKNRVYCMAVQFFPLDRNEDAL